MLAESLTVGDVDGFGLGAGELEPGVGFGDTVGFGVGLVVFGDLLFVAPGRDVCAECVGCAGGLVAASLGSATTCCR
jgi:hypothetical protein